MKKALILATALSFSAPVAFAGGPALLPDDGKITVSTQGAPTSLALGGAAAVPAVVSLLSVLVFATVAGSGS